MDYLPNGLLYTSGDTIIWKEINFPVNLLNFIKIKPPESVSIYYSGYTVQSVQENTVDSLSFRCRPRYEPMSSFSFQNVHPWSPMVLYTDLKRIFS